MSFISKAITKRRTGADTVRPVTAIDASKWDTTASPQVMAAMLDAALPISLKGVVSRTQRGRVLKSERMPGLAGGRVTSSFPSQIAIYRGPNRTWSIAQGLFLRDGKTYIDWTVAVKLEETGDFAVTTPDFLTIDGALANYHSYSEVRGALDASLRDVGPMISVAEQEVGSSELSKVLPGEFASHIGERDLLIIIVVGISDGEIRSRLDTELGLPFLSKGVDCWKFGLGLPDSWDTNWIDVTLISEESEVSIRCLVHVGPPVEGVLGECASQTARLSFLILTETFKRDDDLFRMTPESFQEAMK